MYLSLNPTIVNGKAKWPDFAELASKTGFPAVDMLLRETEAAGLDATRKLLTDLNLKPGIFNFPADFRKDDETWTKTLPALEEAAPFAAAVGCPRMITYIMSSSTLPKDEQRRIYKKRFSEAANILARSHVRLGLEFLGPLHIRQQFPNEFIWRMPEMLAFAKECGPNVGLLLDVWHWHHAGATVQNILEAGRDRIVHIHFNDAPDLPPDQIRDNQRLMPGEGVIDLVGFLRALKKVGYSDAMSVEVFGRGLDKMTPQDAAKLALITSETVMRKAGVFEG